MPRERTSDFDAAIEEYRDSSSETSRLLDPIGYFTQYPIGEPFQGQLIDRLRAATAANQSVGDLIARRFFGPPLTADASEASS